MRDFTYVIIKPDGMSLIGDILKELENDDIEVIAKYKVTDFDRLAVPLYLDDEAILRGNAPIIIGINHIFKQKYGTVATILLIRSKRAEPIEDFIIRVCCLKKEIRRRYIGGYVSYVGSVESDDYNEYNIPFSTSLAKKRCISDNGYIYQFQLNGLHSPDNRAAFDREIAVLEEYGVFNK